jgi:predicted nuclease with TOPRIM domain
MKVSMDGLRWQLLDNYNSLVRKLNTNIVDKTWEPQLTIDVDDIQDNLDNIRSCIVTLAYMFDKSEGGFDILKDPHFEEFNPEIETEENY